MIDWQDLELDEMPDWPLPAQVLVTLAVACLVVLAGYWYWVSPKLDALDGLKSQELELRQHLVRRANQVAALPRVREQVDILQVRYQQVVEQLPEEDELSSLLASVNDIGVRNGLEFQRIEWASRAEHPLYFELPLNINVVGQYEDIGRFAADIAQLPRIVSLKDIDLRWSKPQQDLLQLKVSATTYRFKAPPVEG
ncbi:type 4a pilus biogenesis protein PilO [Photobacterium rosenbergii]|uniref:Type 4a pilus biogenesis protein PilO n=1 Tax=Photobacterium rosenbergii TaxID=294936 RepID=A0ABU3ZM95_9GAMM|nr:type 4a pilus biogenesis protein PilO [Photobacterium rosenbergii]MDV5171235.1 type 4a pilus biogenesis protein PilO [Photobacterium rosenbergii]